MARRFKLVRVFQTIAVLMLGITITIVVTTTVTLVTFRVLLIGTKDFSDLDFGSALWSDVAQRSVSGVSFPRALSCYAKTPACLHRAVRAKN